MATEDIEIRIKATIEDAKAAQTIGDLKKSSQELKDLYEKAPIGSKAFKDLGKALDTTNEKVAKNSKGITELGKAFGSAASKIPGLTEAQEALNLVMEANPIGIVIAALTGLVLIVKQNAEVMDQLSFIMAGVSKVFRTIADDVVEFGKSLINALKNPKKALVDFANFIKNNLVNRFKALSLIMEAIQKRDLKALAKGFLQFETGVENLGDKVSALGNHLAGAAKEGYNSAEALDQLTEKTGEYNLAIDKNNAKIEESKTILLDKTKSEKERVAAAKNVIALENDNSKKRVELAQMELNAEKEKNKGLVLSGEEKKALAEKEGEVIKAQTEFTTSSRRAQIRMNDLLGKSDANLTKDKEKEGKQQVKDAKEIAKEQEALSMQAIEDERVRREAIIGLEKDGLQKQLELLDLHFESEEEKLRKAGLDEVTITTIRNQQILDITQKFNDDQAKQATDIAQKKMDADKQATDDAKKNLDELKAKRDEDNAQIIAGAQAVAGLMNAIGNLVAEADQNREKKTLAEKNKAAKKAFNTQKALGIVNAGIGTAQAVMQALGSMPPPASFVFAALAGVTGAIQIATIAAKKFNPEQPSSGGSAAVSLPSMPSPAAAAQQTPSFKAPQFFGLGQNNLLNQSGADQRVYVVESDITNSQRRVRTTEQRSKLGG